MHIPDAVSYTHLDVYKRQEEGEAFGLLRKRARILGHKPMADFFTGMLNPKLAQPLLKLAGVDLSKKAGELTGKELHRILQQLKSYEAVSYTHLDVYKRQGRQGEELPHRTVGGGVCGKPPPGGRDDEQ